MDALVVEGVGGADPTLSAIAVRNDLLEALSPRISCRLIGDVDPCRIDYMCGF